MLDIDRIHAGPGDRKKPSAVALIKQSDGTIQMRVKLSSNQAAENWCELYNSMPNFRGVKERGWYAEKEMP